jgi:hypothetical protein
MTCHLSLLIPNFRVRHRNISLQRIVATNLYGRFRHRGTNLHTALRNEGQHFSSISAPWHANAAFRRRKSADCRKVGREAFKRSVNCVQAASNTRDAMR